VPCHTYFPWSQDELDAFVSFFGNASSHCLLSGAKTEALNPHHCCRSSSLDSPAFTIHCYKKVISTLITLLTT
jgi:hypothetical protein